MSNALPPLIQSLLAPARYPHPVDAVTLVETHGAHATGDLAHLQPRPGSPEHRRCRFWMHYAEG